MTAGTPIPAGVLERLTTLRDDFQRDAQWGVQVTLYPPVQEMYAELLTDVLDLLAGPARPDGVPDNCIPAGSEAYWEQQEDGRWRLCAFGETWTRAAYSAEHLREKGIPVPPFEPAPEPVDTEQLLVEKIAATCPPTDPAEKPWTVAQQVAEETAAGYVATPPVSERVGPLGLSEGDDGSSFNGATYGTCMANTMTGEPGIFIRYDPAKGMLVELESSVRDWFHEDVFERWDAQPEPAETLDDIVADMREDWSRDLTWTDTRVRRYIDRIEAASRPDPGTITVNRADLRRYVEIGTPYHEFFAARDRLRAALAAAGLPQEPTEPETQR